MWDYDAAGTHILIDGQIGVQSHKIVTHLQRNGFLYSFERANGQTLLATPYQETISWTKGIDQKTGLPVRPEQGHSGLLRFAESNTDRPHQETVPVT
jgi:alcohol dehydrogenase (cytochrome c)